MNTMKKLICYLFVIALFLTMGSGALSVAMAQEGQIEEVTQIEESKEKVLSEMGKQIIFDASELLTDYADYTQFHWEFGDGGSSEGVGVLHSYLRPGYYQALLVAKTNEGAESQLLVNVFVYETLLVGVIDNSVDRERLAGIEQDMFNKGTLLWVVEPGEEGTGAAEEMVDLVQDNLDIVEKSSGVVLWGSGSFGLDLVVGLVQRSDIDLSDLNLAVVTNQRFGNIKQTADATFKIADYIQQHTALDEQNIVTLKTGS